MTREKLIKYLRSNVNIQDPNGVEVIDEAYASLTDEDLALYLEVAVTRDFSNLSIDALEDKYVYPVILIAKKELYHYLATVSAPFYTIVADNNNQLKRSDRFTHYMGLIQVLNAEFKQYNDDGGVGDKNTLTSFDVLLPNRYNTKRNYEKGVSPTLSLFVGAITSTTTELSWSVASRGFQSYVVYLTKSTKSIVDEYKLGGLKDKITSEATLVTTITDMRQNKCRLEGLEPSTAYQVLVGVIDKSTLYGYDTLAIITTA